MPLSHKKQKRQQAELEKQQAVQGEKQAQQRANVRGMNVEAKTPNQALYLETIAINDIIFCTGPAGTGKTFLAIYAAAKKLLSGEVSRIILCRPAVEAGERFGFLPGDLKEKIDPYLQPVYDSLYRLIGGPRTEKFITDKIIEIAPLAFMRGRTFDNAFVVLDEAQNATRLQMKMFLTRMGQSSIMIINGDISQTDLRACDSGLLHGIRLLEGVPKIAHLKMTRDDIVRHPLVQKIIDAYDNDDQLEQQSINNQRKHG